MVELKEILRAHGLKVSGRKSELLERLDVFLKAAAVIMSKNNNNN